QRQPSDAALEQGREQQGGQQKAGPGAARKRAKKRQRSGKEGGPGPGPQGGHAQGGQAKEQARHQGSPQLIVVPHSGGGGHEAAGKDFAFTAGIQGVGGAQGALGQGPERSHQKARQPGLGHEVALRPAQQQGGQQQAGPKLGRAQERLEGRARGLVPKAQAGP